MAIWDKTTQTVTQSADSHKCMSCGSNLTFNPAEGQLVCSSCGSRYYPEAFDINDELIKKSKFILDEDSDGDHLKNHSFDKHEIICNACGSKVIAQSNTISTYCAFCGSPAIVNQRIENEYRPDYIIPFKLTKEDAKNKIHEWAKEREFLPGSFNTKSNYEKITGVYVPFWLVGANCNLHIKGDATRETSYLGNKTYYNYYVERQGTFKMEHVPFDGCKDINDSIMEAIEPFDYKEMVPFADGYLSGFYAVSYDLDPKDMASRIAKRFHSYMRETSRQLIKAEDYSSCVIKEDHSKSTDYDISYALLPVWILSYKYQGTVYKVAVNGQTGEVAGIHPESKWKKRLWKVKEFFKMYSKVILTVTGISLAVGLIPWFFIGLPILLESIASVEEHYWPLNIRVAGLCFGIPLLINYVFLFYNLIGMHGMGDGRIAKFIDRLTIRSKIDINNRFNELNKMDSMPDVFSYSDFKWVGEVIKRDNLINERTELGAAIDDIADGLFE